MDKSTFGYERKAQVPKLEGSHSKLCGQCQAWFAAFGKQRRCDRCVPASEVHRRAQQRHYARVETEAAQRASEGRTAASEPTHTTTRKRRNSPRSARPEGSVSDAGALCRNLAEEMAVIVDLQKGKPRADIGNLAHPMTRALALRYTRRNVALGLQGRSDLDRYATR